jgi:hypothetical protein
MGETIEMEAKVKKGENTPCTCMVNYNFKSPFHLVPPFKINIYSILHIHQFTHWRWTCGIHNPHPPSQKSNHLNTVPLNKTGQFNLATPNPHEPFSNVHVLRIYRLSLLQPFAALALWNKERTKLNLSTNIVSKIGEDIFV